MPVLKRQRVFSTQVFDRCGKLGASGDEFRQKCINIRALDAVFLYLTRNHVDKLVETVDKSRRWQAVENPKCEKVSSFEG